MHGKLFECFITHARTDRYHLMCFIVAHDKKQTSYGYEEISIGDKPIPKTSTTEALEALGDTLNFIDIWLKLFHWNYEVRCGMYNRAMKNIFQKIPTIKLKPLSQGQNFHKLM